MIISKFTLPLIIAQSIIILLVILLMLGMASNMNDNYEYPLMPEWSKDEIISAVEFYAMVEEAYQKGVSKDKFLKKVQEFKKLEPSIASQKRLDRQFEKISGFSIYKAIQTVSKSSKKYVKVER